MKIELDLEEELVIVSDSGESKFNLTIYEDADGKEILEIKKDGKKEVFKI